MTAHYDKKRSRWIAQYTEFSETVWLGRFLTKEEAVQRVEEYKKDRPVYRRGRRLKGYEYMDALEYAQEVM